MTRDDERQAIVSYRLREPVGRGGMGVVHRGTMVSAAGERPVAIKRLTGARILDEAARGQLVLEARLVFQLRHVNICQVIDLCVGPEASSDTFVVMEYVQGLDLRALRERLQRSGKRLDVASAIFVAREVARALDFAHRRGDDEGRPLGLMHGDVTPQNILISDEGEVKLADFGVARALDSVTAERVLGTPGFVAPEVRSGHVDHRADQFGLGQVLRAMLDDSVPSELSAIVAKATALEPERRFLSSGELEHALSVELARRHPTFTPSVLARTVRTALDGEPAALDSEETVLRSLTQTGFKRAAVIEPLATHTKTRPPLRRRWRRFAALAAVILVGGSLSAWRIMGRRLKASTQMVPAPTNTSTSTPVSVATTTQPRMPIQVPAPTTLSAPPKMVRSSRERHRGFLSVDSSRWGAVYIDGRRVSNETPLYRYELPSGVHRVAVRFGDTHRMSPERRISIKAGQSSALDFAQ